MRQRLLSAAVGCFFNLPHYIAINFRGAAGFRYRPRLATRYEDTLQFELLILHETQEVKVGKDSMNTKLHKQLLKCHRFFLRNI
jgi:hypothetical protein